MEFRILDKNFIDMVLLDRYESLLWVDRYNECGDFELYTPPTDELIASCQLGNYLYSKTSDHLMLIEHVELTQSFEEGQKIVIKGRSIECILERRILWYKTQFRKNLEDAIRQILDYSMMEAPDDPDRKIDNFTFEYSNDPRINSIVVDAEFEIGTDLLTVIQTLCQAANLGFKITLNSSNQFVFKLYMGENRSYSQEKNPWVIFSNRFENLVTNQFTNDFSKHKNTVRTVGSKHGEHDVPDFITYGNEKKNLLVLDGESYQINDVFRFQFTCGKLTIGQKYTFTSKVKLNEGTTTEVNCKLVGASPYTRIYASGDLTIQNERIRGVFEVIQPDAGYDDCLYLEITPPAEVIYTLTRPIFTEGEDQVKISGLERREVYNNASSTEYTEEMKEAENGYEMYMAQLQESAFKMLEDNIVSTEVDGSVEHNISYEYGKDYNIGDVVQVENEFGMLGTMRVTEFITSHSESGIEMYPTFKSTTGGTENGSI